MRFEEHPKLAEHIAFLARQPLPITLIQWNEFLAALDQALFDERVKGVEAAPALAARVALDTATADDVFPVIFEAVRFYQTFMAFDHTTSTMRTACASLADAIGNYIAKFPGVIETARQKPMGDAAP